MSNSVLSQPHPKGRNGRNGFDLSFHRSYTSPLGALLPIFWDFALPGDKYKLNTSTFVRTEPLEKAAFARFKHRVEWFFVPMQQLYSRWNEFYNQTNDVMSSIFKNPYSADNYTQFVWPSWQVFPLMGDILTGVAGLSSLDETVTPHFISYNCDEFGVPKIWNFRRLWDLLGYGSLTGRKIGNSGLPSENYLLINFLAYHKIFHSHYLPTQWFKNDPSFYNVDEYYSLTKISPNQTTNKRLIDILCTVHYRPYRKDYFTNIMPSPFWSSQYANFVPGTLFSKGYRFSEYNFQAINTEGGPINQLFQFNSSPESSYNNSYIALLGDIDTSEASELLSTVSTSDLRTLYAFDRFLRVTAFAGSHYQDQVLAHYGVKIPEGISDEAYFLGSQIMDVNVSEVVATSSTGAMEDGVPLSGSTLGDLAGKGFGASGKNKDINFTCPCDGIIMGIQSVELIPDYSSLFIQRQNRYLSTYDFYHPEFDGLGMQPLTTNMLGFDSQASNTLYGWQYRYSELKTNVDVTNEGFWDTDRRTWSPTKQSVLRSVNGAVPGPSTAVLDYSIAYNFFIFPQIANNIFLKKYPYYDNKDYVLKDVLDNSFVPSPYRFGASSSQKCYENDPFLISMDIKAFKTSIMSVFSLDKVL